MTLKEYENKYMFSDETNFDTPSKKLAEEWLDAKIAAMDQISKICREKGYGLVWGEYDSEKGEFENEVDVCRMIPQNDYHIYTGIDKLAKIIGAELNKKKRNDRDNPWEYYFMYKGAYVFQIGGEL